MPQYYVEGFIFSGGLPVEGATIQLVVNATGQRLGDAFKLTGNSYSAWTDRNDWEVSVLFTKPGLKDLKVQMSVLAVNPDVQMEKGVSVPWTYILLVIAAVAVYYNQTKKIGKLGKQDIIPIMILAGGVIGFSLIKKILEGIGIWDSQDSKDLDNASTDPDSWWNPNFWKTKPLTIPYTNPITAATGRALAESIYNSFGAFNDDEESAIAVFKLLPSQAAGSYLSEIFANNYSQDMLTFLRGGNWPQDRLSDSDVNVINNFVNNLPKY